MRRVLLLMKNKIWIYFIAFFVECLMFSGGQVIFSFSNKYVANAALAKSMNLFFIAISLRVIQFIMMVAIYPICVYLVNAAVYKTLNDVKYTMFLHLQKLPKAFFEDLIQNLLFAITPLEALLLSVTSFKISAPEYFIPVLLNN